MGKCMSVDAVLVLDVDVVVGSVEVEVEVQVEVEAGSVDVDVEVGRVDDDVVDVELDVDVAVEVGLDGVNWYNSSLSPAPQYSTGVPAQIMLQSESGADVDVGSKALPQ